MQQFVCTYYNIKMTWVLPMKKSLVTGVFAALAFSIGMSSAVLAENYTPPSLDKTGFAANNEPNVGAGYAPTAAPGGTMERDASNLGGGTHGNSWEVDGDQGELGRQHNNARTNENAQYDFGQQYRFTGDNQLGSSQESHQSALQGMTNNRGDRATPMTETGLLSPPPTKGFHAGSDFGFKGAAGGSYESIYQTKGAGGGYLPGVGTGQLDVNITDTGY
jgi:hypothetical protein